MKETSENVLMTVVVLGRAGPPISHICPFILLSMPKSSAWGQDLLVGGVFGKWFQEARVSEQGEWDREGEKAKVMVCYWGCCYEQWACFYQDLKRSSQKVFQNYVHETMGGSCICPPDPVLHGLRLPLRLLTFWYFWAAFVGRKTPTILEIPWAENWSWAWAWTWGRMLAAQGKSTVLWNSPLWPR